MRVVAKASTSKREIYPTRLAKHLHDDELIRGVGERNHDDDVLTQIPSDTVSYGSHFSEDCSSHGGGSPRGCSKQALPDGHIRLPSIATKPQELDDSDTSEMNVSPTARSGMRMPPDDSGALSPKTPTDIEKDTTQFPRRGRLAMVLPKDAQTLHVEETSSPSSPSSPKGDKPKCVRASRVAEPSDQVGYVDPRKALYSALAETFDAPALTVQPPVEPLGRRRPCKRAVPLNPTNGTGPNQAWTLLATGSSDTQKAQRDTRSLA